MGRDMKKAHGHQEVDPAVTQRGARSNEALSGEKQGLCRFSILILSTSLQFVFPSSQRPYFLVFKQSFFLSLMREGRR